MNNILRWRTNLVENLPGRVLEIGVGSGTNLPLYRKAAHVHGIEPDGEGAVEAHRVAPTGTGVSVAVAENLPYADNSFDHVVSSLVLCSVADQHRVLQELRRVLRPDGVLHMVEHVRPRTKVLAELFRLLTPHWRRAQCNCHLDRPTLAVLVESGWDVEVQRRIFMFVKMKAVPLATPRHGALSPESNTFYQQAFQGQSLQGSDLQNDQGLHQS